MGEVGSREMEKEERWSMYICVGGGLGWKEGASFCCGEGKVCVCVWGEKKKRREKMYRYQVEIVCM